MKSLVAERASFSAASINPASLTLISRLTYMRRSSQFLTKILGQLVFFEPVSQLAKPCESLNVVPVCNCYQTFSHKSHKHNFSRHCVQFWCDLWDSLFWKIPSHMCHNNSLAFLRVFSRGPVAVLCWRTPFHNMDMDGTWSFSPIFSLQQAVCRPS